MTYRSKTKPRPAQLKEFKEHRDKKRRALLWQMRSGKSKAAIDLAEYLFHKGEITAMLILAPNGVHSNWIRKELPTHCSTPWKGSIYRSYAAKTQGHHTALKKAINKTPGHLSVLAINSETVWRKPARRAITALKRIHGRKILLVVDESHDYRSPSSKRSCMVRALAKQINWARILTGTVSANSPLHLWSQFEILEPGALGYTTYEDFKSRYAVIEMKKNYKTGSIYEDVVEFVNQDELRDRQMKWASVVLRQDSGLPDPVLFEEPFVMAPKQRQIYDKLKKTCLIEGTDEAYEGGAKLAKLQQITRGWYYDRHGEPVYIVEDDANPALTRTREVVHGTGGKIIIWARYREEIKKIMACLRKDKVNAVQYVGGMTARDRDKSLDLFTGNPAVKVFVGQPQAGGTGLNLAVANTVFWYSHIFDLIVYEQASERATSGDKGGVDLGNLKAEDSVDEYIIGSLNGKRRNFDQLSGSGLKMAIELGEFI